MSDTQEQTALAVIETLVPAQLYAPGNVEQMIDRIEREVRAQAADLDISTPKNRQALISLARKVSSSKVAMDAAGNALIEDEKRKIDAVNAERRLIRDRMDALRNETRQPVTDWENAEKFRVAANEATIAAIVNTGQLAVIEWDSCDLAGMLADLSDYDSREWDLDFRKKAIDALAKTKQQISDAMERYQRHEAEQAELARLRAEEKERQRIAAEEARIAREAEIARQAAEQARIEAERKAAEEAARIERERQEEAARESARVKAEQERRAAEAQAERDRLEAEQRRIEQEKLAAEERAKQAEAARLEAIEAGRRAAENAERRSREAAEMAAERARQAAEQAEREKQAAIEAERQRVEVEKRRLVEEEQRRAADRAHKARIHCEMLDDMLEAIDEHHSGSRHEAEKICKALIAAIATKKVRHIGVQY